MDRNITGFQKVQYLFPYFLRHRICDFSMFLHDGDHVRSQITLLSRLHCSVLIQCVLMSNIAIVNYSVRKFRALQSVVDNCITSLYTENSELCSLLLTTVSLPCTQKLPRRKYGSISWGHNILRAPRGMGQSHRITWDDFFLPSHITRSPALYFSLSLSFPPCLSVYIRTYL
jgi:hypothetical protein